MKMIKIANTELNASQIVLGLMRINTLGKKEAANLISTAVEQGINYFDHADIYGAGKCEEIFAEAIKDAKINRESLLIQSKCGIRNGFFDFSKEHILNSVDGILNRLDTEYIDTLLLHRPDTLMEPEDVADAFDTLYQNGKVRNFGISNQNPMQIELLKRYVKQPLVFNQLQLSITNTGMIDTGLNVNMSVPNSFDHDGSILEYCRLNDITIQPWSPFQYGFFEGVFLGSDKYPELNKIIDKMAKQYNVTNSAIAIAWILRHPSKMQPIVGTTSAKRLAEICKAVSVSMSRQEWYEIYCAAGNKLP